MKKHLVVLDGWRGISILSVLAAHLLPLGQKGWQVNEAMALFGMSLFFTLSGFLITSFLLEKESVTDFLIRRFFRILPLAWVGMTVGLLMVGATYKEYVAHYLFFANLPPFFLKDVTGHFWSLCVEMHFYIGIAILVSLFRGRWQYLIPGLLLLVTGGRILTHTYATIETYLRIDEILAGSMLAILYKNKIFGWGLGHLKRVSAYIGILALAASCFPQAGPLNYARPYLAAVAVGVTLVRKEEILYAVLASRFLRYIAEISYALYVIHQLLAFSWFGGQEDDKVIKYMKRFLLLFPILFALAHISTFYFEKKCIALGRRLSERLKS